MNDDKVAPTADEIYRLVKENNRMLKQMRRDAFVKGILALVWWIFILVVLPYLSWLYIQPYLEQVIAAYQGIESTKSSVDASLKGLPDLTKLIQQLGGGQ